MSRPLSSTLATLWPETPAEYAAVAVSGITASSREVKKGDLFVAQKGMRHDARDYVEAAIAQGAAAVLVERDGKWPAHRLVQGVPVLSVESLPQQLGHVASRLYGNPSAAMTVLAVTGTNGKTSVAHLLAGALTGLGRKSALLGTVGNGFYGALASASHTTPDAIHLQKMLAQFRDAGAEFVAMEASSHGLEQGRLNGTRIHTALFTNLTRDHLDYHGSMEAYGAAKRRLFAWPGLAAAVLNADDAACADFRAALAPDVRVSSYSLRQVADAELVAAHIEPSLSGLAVTVRAGSQTVALRSPLLGRFNVSNLLAVLGGLRSVGIALPEALAALAKVPAVPGRMECISVSGAPRVVVDYAHTPDALEKVLRSLREHTPAGLWCVFGCGGDRDRGKRPQMAAVAEQLADQVVLTSDNPRSEQPEAIIAEIEAGLRVPQRARVVIDRKAAIRQSVEMAGGDDIVLVAGKGHEDYQEIAGVRHPFSDVQEVRAALAARGGA